MPKTDSLNLQCSFIYPQTGKKCLNESDNRSFCSLHLILKCSNNNNSSENVDLINQQNILEEKTNQLIQRVKRIQYNQLIKHISKQLCAFVKQQQEQLNINCQHPQITNKDLLDKNLLISNLQAQQTNLSNEDKQKLYSHGYFKNLPTSQLVKLVKKLEQDNLNNQLNQQQQQQLNLINQQQQQQQQNNNSNNNQLNKPILPIKEELINLNNNNNEKQPQPPQPTTIQIKEEITNSIPNLTTTTTTTPTTTTTTSTSKKKDKQQQQQQQNQQTNKSLSSSNIIVNRKNISPKFNSDQIKQINSTTGILRTSLKHFEHSYDSDATDSSSGGESCDELDDYLNDLCKQQKLDLNSITTLPLNQKTNWKWAIERGQIASKWTWLQAQIADLDFKIRQQNEIYKQFRQSKGQISFYSNESVNQTVNGELQSTCIRTLPLKEIKKRKLVRSVFALANSNRKLQQRHSTTVLCSCNSLPAFSNSCVLCNERYSYIQMIDTDCMPISERVSLLDPSFHSVLSLPENISLGLHFSKLLKKETVQRPIIRNSNYKKKKINPRNELSLKFKSDLKSKKKSSALIQSTKLKKKYEGNKKLILNKNKQNKVRLNRVKDRQDHNLNYLDENSRHDSPSPIVNHHHHHHHNNNNNNNNSNNNENGNLLNSQSVFNRRRRSEQNAFDINNIVIPYSIASTTRVQKLEYKEIITPKWRVTEGDEFKEEEEEEEEKEEKEKEEIIVAVVEQQEKQEKKEEEEMEIDNNINDNKSPIKSLSSLNELLTKSSIPSLPTSITTTDQQINSSLDIEKMDINESSSSINQINNNNSSSTVNNLSSPTIIKPLSSTTTATTTNNNTSSNNNNNNKINSIVNNEPINNDEDSNLSESTDISEEHKSDSLEDLSDQIFIERHLKCEVDEKKRFCSFLKNPLGSARGRSSVRQRTESTKSESINLESNTIDGSSQDSFSNMQINLNMNNMNNMNNLNNLNNTTPSKAKSPDCNSLVFEESNHSNQSTSKQRSYSLSSKTNKEDLFDEEDSMCKIEPFEKRNFPLNDNELNELTMYLD